MSNLPASPNEMVGGLVWFARMLSKVRLNERGHLPAEYRDHLGVGYDGWCLRFLQVDYAALVRKVKEDLPDEAVLEWCFSHGRRPTEIEIWTWNDCIRKRGWRDDWNGGSAKLEQMKYDYGLAGRADIQTFFDLFDADEGRLPALAPKLHNPA